MRAGVKKASTKRKPLRVRKNVVIRVRGGTAVAVARSCCARGSLAADQLGSTKPRAQGIKVKDAESKRKVKALLRSESENKMQIDEDGEWEEANAEDIAGMEA